MESTDIAGMGAVIIQVEDSFNSWFCGFCMKNLPMDTR